MSSTQKNEPQPTTTIEVTPAQLAILNYFEKGEVKHRLKNMLHLEQFLWREIAPDVALYEDAKEALYFFAFLKNLTLDLMED